MGRFIVILVSAVLWSSFSKAELKKDQLPKFTGIKYVNKTINKKVSDFGAIEVGDSVEAMFGWQHPNTAEPAYYTLGSASLAGGGYSIVSDTCSGGTLTPSSGACQVKVKFIATVSGSLEGSYNLPYTAVLTDTTTTSGSLSQKLVVDVIEETTEENSNPDSPCAQLKFPGSIVRTDGQSVGEEVPVVGAKFKLTYSSEHAQSYTSSYSLPTGLTFFRPYGLTISIQHYFDVATSRLFRGTGTSERSGTVDSTSSNFRVASLDGSEVYIFSPTGKHIETKFGLTGATKFLFAYDTSNRLSSVTDSYGNITSFTYSVGGYTITSPFGQVTSVSLNSASLVSSITLPSSETYSYTYKLGTDLVEVFTKPGGQTNTFTYSTTGRLTQDLSSGGAFWNLLEELNTTDRKVTLSSALGRSTVFRSKITKGKNVRQTLEPFGLETEYSEKPNHSGSSETSDIDSIHTYHVGDPRFGGVVRRPITRRVVRNTTTSSTFYERDYVPSSPSNFFTFDSVTDSATIGERKTTTVYTTIDKSRITTFPTGVQLRQSIDDFEKPLSMQVGTDTAWTFSYDTAGRLLQAAQGLFNSTTNTYNTAGFLASVTNARNETTSYAYDLAGRITQVTRPDSNVVSYSYDSNGNMTGITPPGKLQHIFEFNAFELPSKYDPPALTGVSVKETLYSYNLDKQLTSIVRPDTQTATFTYGSSSGLLNQVSIARGNNNYTYKTNTNLVSRIDSADGIRSNYEYHGSLTSAEEQRRASDDFLYARLIYGFDASFRKISRSIRGGSSPFYATVASALNDDGKPTNIGSMSLQYSNISGRLTNTFLGNISDSRTYDALGNLESYTSWYTPTGGTPQVLYTYTLTRDIASRISGKTETIQGTTTTYAYTYDVVGRLTGVSKNGTSYSTYVYDANGNRTSGSVNGVAFTAAYDDQDRLVSYNTRTYTYNANGDNTKIQYSPTIQATFNWDALGSLTSAVSTAGNNMTYAIDGNRNIVRVASGGITATRYIYENPQRIAGEFTDAGVMWRQFVYGTDTNSPDYLIDSTGNYRFIKDHLGSPRLVVKVTDGTVMHRMDYDEFGKVLVNTNPTYQPFGFAGGIYFRLFGIVKFGARFYDAETGRWLSKDPILFNGGDANLFGYVANDPVNLKDPEGKTPYLAMCVATAHGACINRTSEAREVQCAKEGIDPSVIDDLLFAGSVAVSCLQQAAAHCAKHMYFADPTEKFLNGGT